MLNNEVFQQIDSIVDSIQKPVETKSKKRGRPKKNPDPEFTSIDLDLNRFEEERGRIIRYLENISNRSMGAFEAISILEDLGVILDTHELSKDIVLQQLRDNLDTVYRRR